MSMFFFFLFALVLLLTYLAVRRQWASPLMTASGGMLAGMLTMILYLIARGSGVLQGVVLGMLIGGALAGADLAMAWYFQSSEIRAQYAAHGYTSEEYGSNSLPTEDYHE